MFVLSATPNCKINKMSLIKIVFLAGVLVVTAKVSNFNILYLIFF